MVWLEKDDVPQLPFFQHSHFVLTPSQLYFFPKGQLQAINCRIKNDTIQTIIDFFNYENLKSTE